MQSGLARLNELLEPALTRAEAFTSGAFLVATSSTTLLPVADEIQTVYLDEGIQLQAFIPTAFLVPCDEKNEPRAIPHDGISFSTYVFPTPVSPLN